MMPLAILSAATLLGGAAIMMAFFKRMPAVALAFAAMLVASVSGFVTFTADQLWFWGVATAIALGIQYLGSGAISRQRSLYTTGATLVGTVLGLTLGTEAAVIIAGAVAAFLGYEAYGRTPAGRRHANGHRHLDAFATVALPALVNFSIIMLIFSQLLLIK